MWSRSNADYTASNPAHIIQRGREQDSTPLLETPTPGAMLNDATSCPATHYAVDDDLDLHVIQHAHAV